MDDALLIDGASALAHAHAAAGVSASANADADGMSKSPSKRGHRTQSVVWRLLTFAENPHRETRSVCRHCAQPVPHHRKSEKARAHLLRCAAFRAFADTSLPAHERPAWLDQQPAQTRAIKQERAVKKLQQQQQQRRKSADAPPAKLAALGAAGASGETAMAAAAAAAAVASSASSSVLSCSVQLQHSTPTPTPIQTPNQQHRSLSHHSESFQPAAAATQQQQRPLLSSWSAPEPKRRRVDISGAARTLAGRGRSGRSDHMPATAIDSSSSSSTAVASLPSSWSLIAPTANGTNGTTETNISTSDAIATADTSTTTNGSTIPANTSTTHTIATTNMNGSATAAATDLRALHAALAMFFYSTGAPFRGVESTHLQTAFQLCGVSGTALPTAASLSGPLLDDAYAATLVRVRTALRAFEFSSIVVTGWSAAARSESSGCGADNASPPPSSSLSELSAASANADVVAYMVVNEQHAFLAESSSRAAEQQLDADALAAKISGLMSRFGDTISGVVTDVSPVHQHAWSQLRAVFPRRFFHGCASHGLQLLVRDIFGPAAAAAAAGVTGIVGPQQQPLLPSETSPLEPLARLTESCRRVLTLLAMDERASAELAQLVQHTAASASAAAAATASSSSSTTAPVAPLSLPPLTSDWRSLRPTFAALLAVHAPLRAVVSARDFVTRPFDSGTAAGTIGTTGTTSTSSITIEDVRTRVQQDVLSSEFAALLAKAVALLELLERLARVVEAPRAACSDVVFAFAHALPDAVAKLAASQVLSAPERASLVRAAQTRLDALSGDAHGIAYVLDPRYIGEGLGAAARQRIEDMIFELPTTSAEHSSARVDVGGGDGNKVSAGDSKDKDKGDVGSDEDEDEDDRRVDVAQQLTEFLIDAAREKSSQSFRYTLLRRRKKTPLQYWLTDGQRWPLLQRLACEVFSLPATTRVVTEAAATAAQIPSALRASFSPAALAKLVFVRANAEVGEVSSGASGADSRGDGAASA